MAHVQRRTSTTSKMVRLCVCGNTHDDGPERSGLPSPAVRVPELPSNVGLRGGRRAYKARAWNRRFRTSERRTYAANAIGASSLRTGRGGARSLQRHRRSAGRVNAAAFRRGRRARGRSTGMSASSRPAPVWDRHRRRPPPAAR